MTIEPLRFGAAYSGLASALSLKEFGRKVEALGFDSAWTSEHILWRGPILDALTSLSVIAGATERVSLGTSVMLLPLRHPTPMAKALTTLDVGSGGRLIAGFGVGGENPAEFAACGVPHKERGGRTNESLEIIKRLWTESKVTYHGRYFTLDNITMEPRPVQKPHPPILIGGRKEAAMRRAVRYASGWIPYLYSPEQYKSSLERISAMAGEEGRSLEGFQHALHVFTAFGPTPQEAVKTAARNLGARYGQDFEQIVMRYALLGTAQDITTRLRQYVEAGARHIVFAWACSAAEAVKGIEAMAADVLPALRYYPKSV